MWSRFYGPVCVCWWDLMRALLVLWVSDGALPIIGCCVAMWNETATGKGEKSGYPWKAFLFDQFQISVLSIMCVKNVFAVFFLQFSLKKIWPLPQKDLGCCVSHCNNVFNTISYHLSELFWIIILPLEWRQKKRHQSHSCSLSQTVCAGCFS